MLSSIQLFYLVSTEQFVPNIEPFQKMDQFSQTELYHIWTPVGWKSLKKWSGLVSAELTLKLGVTTKESLYSSPAIFSRTTLNAVYTKNQKSSGKK